MSKFGSNPFVKLTDLLTTRGPQVATVAAVNTDGTVTVTILGGGQQRVRASQPFGVGDRVIVQRSLATSKAPTLPSANTNI